ncbi:uncharacterized protein VTP21DRAFT_11661 [Calcarisporiella thermophila]|uniref:uncharacterized protein n=1 Tax=Calcarisporiella thermophila TaxID=911321 RepID=UPI003741F82E
MRLRRLLLALLLTFFVSVSYGQDESDTPQEPSSSSVPSPSQAPNAPQNQGPSARIPNPEYAKLLNSSLYFYMAQRSGKLPPNFPVPWRHDSALDDGKREGADLTGGYYDAGDYLKFTFPLSYTLTIVSWGAIEFEQGYRVANQYNAVLDMLRWGMDWMQKAHPTKSELYVQVGDLKRDHDYFGDDTNIPQPRPIYKITADKPGTDAAASAAAAFAASSIVFQNTDADYSKSLLNHAIELFEFAETAPYALYHNSLPTKDSQEAYGSSQFEDDLVWGALWLYRATNDTAYKQKASDYFDRFSAKLAGKNNPMDWDDKTGGVYVLGARVDPATAKYKLEAEKYLDAKVKFSDKKCSLRDGLMWCGDSSGSNSLQPPMNTAFLMLTYASQVNKDKNETYYPFVQTQLDYVMGKNPMNTPYVVGIHPNSPLNPHHAGSFAGDIGRIRSSAPNKNLLLGALVGGPGEDGWYDDDRENDRQSEVACDYNAAYQGVLAYQALTNPNPPYYASVTLGPRPTRRGLPTWAIALIVVLVLLVVFGCAGFFLYRMRHKIREMIYRRRMGKTPPYY